MPRRMGIVDCLNFFFFQAEDGIRDLTVTGVQTCALPICALAIIALFAVLVWRGLRVGLRAPDPFGAYLALGITVLIATQTLVNLGVVTGALPTKGLPLPFISFGGSALLVTMAGTGVLLNISQHAHV